MRIVEYGNGNEDVNVTLRAEVYAKSDEFSQ